MDKWFSFVFHGRYRLGSTLIFVFIYLCILALVILSGGSSSTAMFYFATAVLIAGFFIDSRLVNWLTIPTFLFAMVISFLQTAGLLAIPQVFVFTSFFSWLAIGLGLLFMVRARDLIVGNLRNAIVSAQQKNAALRQIQATLRENEALLSNAFNHSPLLMTISDLSTGTFLEVNDSFCAISEFSRQEAIGKTSIEIGWLDEEERLRLVSELHEHGNVTGLELKLHSKSGKMVICSYVGEIIQTVAGPRLFSTAEDITARKLTEEALRQSEAKFRAVVDNSNDGILFGDAQARILYRSPSYSRINGYSDEDRLGKSGFETVHPDDLDGLHRYWTTLVENPEMSQKAEYRIRHKDGTWRWIETSGLNLLGNLDVKSIVVTSRDITARKQAEEALRESELRFRTIIENAPIAISIGRNGKLLYANSVYAHMYGFTSADEVIGQPTIDRVAPQHRPVTLERARQRAQNLFLEEAPYELEGLRRDGTQFPMLVSVAQVKLPDGPANIGFIQDISERKHAEETLQLSEQSARRTAEQLQIVNRIGVKISAGLDFEPLMHTIYEQCQQIGDTDTFYIALYDETTGIVSFPFNYKDGERCIFAAFNTRETPGLAGYIIQSRQTLYIQDESYIPAGIIPIRQPGLQSHSFVGVPLILNDRVVGILSLQSYTPNAYSPEQIQTLELLATQVAIAIQNSQLYEQVQSESNLANALIDNLPGGVGLIDRQGRLLRWNKFAENAIHYSPGEIQDLNFSAVFPEGEQARLQDLIAQGFAGLRLTVEIQLITKYGEKIPFFATGTRVQIGSEIYLLVILLDITERKQAEEEIRQLNLELEQRVRNRTAQLEASNQELEAFSYSVSHDLRAPLRALSGFSEILSQKYGASLDEDGKQYLAHIQEASQRMKELIDALLELSRVSRKVVDVRQVDLSKIAREIMAEFQRGMPQRVVEVVIADGLTVQGDTHLLRNVMQNLLDNAWKFSMKCTRAKIEVGVFEQARADNGLMEKVYYVRDNGAGFDMAYADKLFAPFQRLHKVNEYPGTGVGLSTVQRIINRHGGRVWVQASPDHGASFFFTLGEMPEEK